MTCNRLNTSQDFCSTQTASAQPLCPWPVPTGTSEVRVGENSSRCSQSNTHFFKDAQISSAVGAHSLHKTTATCHKTCVRHAKACSSCQKKHVKNSRANLKGANFFTVREVCQCYMRRHSTAGRSSEHDFRQKADPGVKTVRHDLFESRSRRVQVDLIDLESQDRSLQFPGCTKAELQQPSVCSSGSRPSEKTCD